MMQSVRVLVMYVSIRSAFMLELRRELGDRFEHFQSLDWRAGASLPSRATGPNFLFIYIYIYIYPALMYAVIFYVILNKRKRLGDCVKLH